MNIYFVNRYSKLKGPFDIIDSNRQHIIKVGDICLRDTIEGVLFYVVYNSTNMWNACQMVGVGKNDTLSETGNTLLFSFDGLSRRKGDIQLIEQFALCFREKVIDDFFRNAVDILKYKKDLWDGSLFPQLFASSQEFVIRDEQKISDESTETNYYPTVFAQYLSKELLELLTTSLNEGNELKEAYLVLREKHPEMFRKALMQFLTENPSSSIYDEPADTFVPAVTEVESPMTTIQNGRQFRITHNIVDESLKPNERTEKYLSEIGYQELISIDEEIELAQKVRKGEIDARNKLVSANMRFVVELAKQYLHKGLEFEDLLHEGFRGLIRAAERFDETRGFKFISYAAWWIRRYLTDAILGDSSLIRFPLNVQILHRRIWDFKIRYERQKGFMPPITDIEIEDEDNLERISYLDNLPSNLKNICIPCEDLDAFEDNHNDILDFDESEYKKQYVRNMLDRLSKREREILIRVYGIGVREETLEAIGESRGLTRERVRQIKEKAIKKLRKMTSFYSVEEKLSQNKSSRKEVTTGQNVTTNNTIETKTLREVKTAFMLVRSNIVQISEAKRRKATENDRVILPSEKSNETSRKEIDLNTRNYTVVNNNGKCNIYDSNKSLVYSSTGIVKEINNSFYRVSLTHSFFSIGMIKRNHKGELFNAGKILLANQQTKLHQILRRNSFIEMIEDIELDGRRRVKVDGCWFDERGNEVFEETNSDSSIIEHYEVKKESIKVNNARKPETPNVIDEFDVEHVFVDTTDALPYRDVEVEIEQPNKDKATEGGETPPIWTYVKNIRFPKRSKKFLKCKCRVGLSKTGYYLIINHKFIKLGDYPDGYECNVGNIWIKRPIDDKGYRMIHENEKGGHLIGYTIEKGEIVVFTNPANDVYCVTIDGKIVSEVKNKEAVSLRNIDINKLQHAFDTKVTSYKYFWFLAIISLTKEEHSLYLTYKEILIRMAALAWPIVMEHEMNLGKQDMLGIYLWEIVKCTSLDKQSPGRYVEFVLDEQYKESGIDRILSPLLNNVPYRFLSPWVRFTTNKDVLETSKSDFFDGLYALNSNGIVLNSMWWQYIKDHYQEICDFSIRSFISFALLYNDEEQVKKLRMKDWNLLKK